MAGLKKDMPHPESLTLHGQTRVLEIGFSDGAQFRIPFELMRVYSPSAEVQGHGPGQEVLQTGKRQVGLLALEPVGNYAVQPTFDDGHDSGIFSWDYLYFLGSRQAELWADYEARLQAAGAKYVMVPNLPDIGLTPMARAGGPAAMAQYTAVATAYNNALYGGLTQAGIEFIPLDTFNFLREITSAPGQYGFANVTTPACGAVSSLRTDSRKPETPKSMASRSAALSVPARTHRLSASSVLSSGRRVPSGPPQV